MQNSATPQAAKPEPTMESFVKNALRSGLLQRGPLDEALRAVPKEEQGKPQALADHLVKTGKLTRFQAFKLIQGAALGLVLGPFQVLAPLGKGGMGSVYLARDSRSGQLLALKVLPPKKAREEERLLARFQREMSLSQLLSHPNLAQSYESGVYQGVYYIAMEFIAGKSLYKLVNGQGPLAVARAARLFTEVTEGLEHAHGRGLIHRDLKPSNIMITPNDHAKVLDLGLAIIQGEVATDRTIVGGQGYVVGTMDYLAPEQAEDAVNVDARADIYALGCTLYFVLTGRPPFPGGTAMQKIMRHYTEEPVPVLQLNSAVPPGFHDIVRRMMAKRPDDRYPSAAAVRKELWPWISGEAVLPLDSKDSEQYQRAVTEISSMDLAPEMLWAEIIESAQRLNGQSAVAEAPPDAGESEPARPRIAWSDRISSLTTKLRSGFDVAITIGCWLDFWLPVGLFALLLAGLLYLLLGLCSVRLSLDVGKEDPKGRGLILNKILTRPSRNDE